MKMRVHPLGHSTQSESIAVIGAVFLSGTTAESKEKEVK